MIIDAISIRTDAQKVTILYRLGNASSLKLFFCLSVKVFCFPMIHTCYLSIFIEKHGALNKEKTE